VASAKTAFFAGAPPGAAPALKVGLAGNPGSPAER
jgi:hypothetical protein